MARSNPVQCAARSRSGMMRSRLWPIASSAEKPNTAVAAGFQARITPCGSAKITASAIDSTIARAVASSGTVSSGIGQEKRAIRRFAEEGRMETASRTGARAQQACGGVLGGRGLQQPPQDQRAAMLGREVLGARASPPRRRLGRVATASDRIRDQRSAAQRIADAIAGERIGEVRGIAY